METIKHYYYEAKYLLGIVLWKLGIAHSVTRIHSVNTGKTIGATWEWS